MRWPNSLTFFLGLAAGGIVVALLPETLLFRPTEAHSEAATTGERYACPMMDFIGNKPGNCPVCGMKLVKVTAGEMNAEQVRRVGLQTSIATLGPAIATVRAYGAVRYDDRTAVAVIPRIGGRVVKRYPAVLHMGNLVEEGDALVDIYSPEAYAAQGELAAAVKLGDKRTVEAITARFNRWNLPNVAAAIVSGADPVDTVTITSPASGRIIQGVGDTMESGLPEVGKEIMPDSALLRLIDPHAFMVVIHVPEVHARWVSVGQAVRLASDDAGELPDVEASVSWVSPEFNLEIRALEVHLHLTDPHERLLPGSLVNARFQVALSRELTAADWDDRSTWGQFILVPKTAILSTGVRNVAWKVAERFKDGRMRFELASLALGPRLEDEDGNDRYIIRAGLDAGDEVATQGAFLIDSQAQLAGSPSLLFPMGSKAASPAHAH
ncbi:MAG: efflux RND transporter periplasmic adaptor subunit [Verrucomicrobiota bacterium]|nr:efflux RND transporter periplasmic adaptor subunit [Verrucomicrobiota bacterium]